MPALNGLSGRSRRRGGIGGTRLSFLEPTNLLLLACALIYGLMGEWVDGGILLLFVVGISLLVAVQQQRSNRALAELARLSAPRAHVRRDGQELDLPAEQVRLGDLLRLEEGDRVAADAAITEAVGLWLDESLLTGESLPVERTQPEERVLAGSLVAGGRGWAEVVAVAEATELGQLGKSLATVEPPPTRLQRQTRRMTSRLTLMALGLCAALAVIQGGISGDWPQALIAALALALAVARGLDGVRGPGGPAAAGCAGGDRHGAGGGGEGGDDHGRQPGDGPHRRCVGVRPGDAPAEAAAGARPAGRRRGGGDDRRWRQRRPGPEGRRHRRGDGQARHRRGPGIRRSGAAQRHLRRSGGGLELGRRVDANLHRALGYTLAIHLPIAALSLVPLLLITTAVALLLAGLLNRQISRHGPRHAGSPQAAGPHRSACDRDG